MIFPTLNIEKKLWNFGYSMVCGIGKATQMAFRKAVKSLDKRRDKLMKKLHRKYPQYGFSKHKGYGTKFHRTAIKKYGLSRIHRKSFNLIKFL